MGKQKSQREMVEEKRDLEGYQTPPPDPTTATGGRPRVNQGRNAGSH